jgi:hypothetical protein
MSQAEKCPELRTFPADSGGTDGLSPPLAQRSTSAIFGLFAGLFATMEGSDFSCLFFIGFDSSSSRRGPPHTI